MNSISNTRPPASVASLREGAKLLVEVADDPSLPGFGNTLRLAEDGLRDLHGRINALLEEIEGMDARLSSTLDLAHASSLLRRGLLDATPACLTAYARDLVRALLALCDRYEALGGGWAERYGGGVLAAGRFWDAVRVPRGIGRGVLARLGQESGAVIDDSRYRVMYWLIPARSGRRGPLGPMPESLATIRSLGFYVAIPARNADESSVLSWANPCDDGRLGLTHPGKLRDALYAEAARWRGAKGENTPG